MTVLEVATGQFPVSADIEQNAAWMARQTREAAHRGARVAHFPEGALSGYAGADFTTFTGYDWGALDRATEGLWISCPNSSAPESLWPAFFVRPDGITTGRLERNQPGVLLSTVDTDQDLYDSTGPWRRRAIAGTLHSGELAPDDH